MQPKRELTSQSCHVFQKLISYLEFSFICSTAEVDKQNIALFINFKELWIRNFITNIFSTVYICRQPLQYTSGQDRHVHCIFYTILQFQSIMQYIFCTSTRPFHCQLCRVHNILFLMALSTYRPLNTSQIQLDYTLSKILSQNVKKIHLSIN